MLLADRLLQQGQWTFDHRGRLLLSTLVLLVPGVLYHELFMDSASAELGWTLGCLAISLVGQGLRIAAIGTVPKGTSGRKKGSGPQARSLNTTGMYSVVRNPLYVGNSLVHIGLLATTRSPALLIIFGLALALYYERILLAEENFLRGVFKDRYEAWAAKTPAFFPRWSQWVKPENGFKWAMVFRREGSGISGIFCAYFVLQSAYRSVEAGALTFDAWWGYAALASLAFYMVCNLLKKHSSLLDIAAEETSTKGAA